jgi:hypothetical protein
MPAVLAWNDVTGNSQIFSKKSGYYFERPLHDPTLGRSNVKPIKRKTDQTPARSSA